MKHLKSDCTVHHITFGGGCLNCGAGMQKTALKPSKKERIQFLRAMGVKFPKK